MNMESALIGPRFRSYRDRHESVTNQQNHNHIGAYWSKWKHTELLALVTWHSIFIILYVIQLILSSTVMAATSILLLFLFTYEISASPTKCPAFSDWNPWTECLWHPVQDMYDNLTIACGMKPKRNLAGLVHVPKDYKHPERCGHCSFKSRCRTRDKSEHCFPFEYEHEVCHDYSDICTMAKLPHVGCAHDIWREMFAQCANRPDISDLERANYKKTLQSMPQTHCIEKDGQCKCCCGDYEPNETGTECIRPPAAKCAPFEKSTDWSDCLWFPLKDMEEHALAHCKVKKEEGDYQLHAKVPEGLEIPEKCGFCSFRVSCEKRERKDGCFPLKFEKKSCGQHDCPTCGNVCTVDKVNGTCGWTRHAFQSIFDDFTAKSKESGMPHWRYDGLMDMLSMLPYGNCKEVGDKCKCCCHPYEPNDDGTKCVLKGYCATLDQEVHAEKPQRDCHDHSSESSEEKQHKHPSKHSSESHEHHKHDGHHHHHHHHAKPEHHDENHKHDAEHKHHEGHEHSAEHKHDAAHTKHKHHEGHEHSAEHKHDAAHTDHKEKHDKEEHKE